MNSFTELQRTWYLKLKQSGFNDIECFGTQMEAHDLMRGSVGYIVRSRDRFKERANYYRMISLFLHDYSFETLELYRIFEGFSEGKTYRAIAAREKRSTYYVFTRVKGLLEGPFKEYIEAFEDHDEGFFNE